MTKTFKILSAISFIALAIVLTFVGVWALADLNFTIGGDIGYTVPVPISPDEVSYLTFSYNDADLTAEVTGFDGSVTQIKIPSLLAHNDKIYKVTSISGDSGNMIYGGVFTNENITDVSLPSTLLEIGNYAFYRCKGLTSIIIPNSVISIGQGAFSGCSNLASVKLSENLQIIYGPSGSLVNLSMGAFNSCTSLTSITIPDSVTSIDKYAFSSCTGLVSIRVENGNSVYDSRNNCNAIIETATNTLISGCKNTSIPNTVTGIGSYAFYNCTGLTSITIPDSVTSIGTYVFASCTNLATVTVLATTPPARGNQIFTGCSSLTTIKVPTNSVDAYSDWSSYAEIVDGGF